MNERIVRNIFRQICYAVNHLHLKGICHRDIKPENLLFSNTSPNSSLKLIDFGFAKEVDRDQGLKSILGTPYYISPDVLTGDYGLPCDVWSIGVVLYILLSGIPPFHGPTT
jgi:calcium-dependent protein kinase